LFPREEESDKQQEEADEDDECGNLDIANERMSANGILKLEACYLQPGQSHPHAETLLP